MEDGSIEWIKSYINMTKNPYTNDVEAIIYAININDQKIIEALTDTVIKNNYDFIMLIDAVKGTTRTYGIEKDRPFFSEYDDVNRVSRAFLSRCYVGDDFEEFIRKTSIAGLVKSLAMKSRDSLFYSLKSSEGQLYHKCFTYSYLEAGSQFICCVIRDITDVYEEEKRKNIEMKNALDLANKANKAKSIFLSKMSHEIRTPMNAIFGMTKLALDEVEDSLAVRYLNKIYSAGEYLLRLINDILDMSRIEQNKIEFISEVVEVDKFFDNIVSIIKPLAEEKQINFKFIKNESRYPYLKFDKIRGQQVIVNLISNAIKFTRTGGNVEVYIEFLEENDKVAKTKLVVKDNGIGMSEESS